MHRGYIKLYRKLTDSKFWLSESFTRPQAWVDLIGLANHDDGFIRKRGIRVDLKRGEVGWGERELAERWRWSRNKVRRFLSELCSENESKMIPQTGPQNKNVTSCYLIVNYELYQGTGTTEGTTSDTTEGPQKDRKRYQNKNEKNDKKEKNKEVIVFSLPDWFPSETWDMFISHRKAVKAPIAKGTENTVIKQFQKWKEQGYDPQMVVENMINRGWRGFKPEWLNNGEGNGKPSRVPKPDGFAEKKYIGSDLSKLSWNKSGDENVQ